MEPVVYIGLAILLYFGSTFLYALRWKVVLRGFHRDASYRNLVLSSLSAIFVNNVTPLARAGGEAVRVVWVNVKDRIPKSLLTASIIYERATEAIVVTVLAVFVLAGYANAGAAFVVLGIAAIASVVLITRMDLVLRVIERLSKEKISKEMEGAILQKLRVGKTLAAALAISTILWVMDILRIGMELAAVGVKLTWTQIATVSILNVLIGFAAITPGGLGIVEGGLMGILTGMGLTVEDAAKVVAIERGISFILGTVIGGIVTGLYGGKEIWKHLKSDSRLIGFFRGSEE